MAADLVRHLRVEVEPEFLFPLTDVNEFEYLQEHTVEAEVTSDWRKIQRAKFDQHGQVFSEEWHVLIDYTVDKVFVDGKAVPLNSLHLDIQDAITNSNGMWKAVSRKGGQ
jgi:hypothetical protein